MEPGEGQEATAIAWLRSAIDHGVRDPELFSDLGIAYRQIGRMEQAIHWFREAERLDPQNPTWRIHTANALVEHGDLTEGIRHLEALLAVDPGHPQAHWQLANALLLLGRFQEAWPHFAWRWRCPSFPSRRLATLQPAWDGRSACRRLLIWGEQGVGDEVLFAGLLPEVRQRLAPRGIEVRLLVDGRLVRPLRRAWPEVAIHAWGTAAEVLACDQHLPAGDLCRLLGADLAEVSRRPASWLRADPARQASLEAVLPRAGRLRCGIAWHSAAGGLGPRKSLPLELLARPLALPGVELVCLQYGEVAEEIVALRQRTGIAVHQVAGLDLREDLDGLSALIRCCDLVITISNVTAHLSGALGRETWLLLHQVPYWPWQLEGETCCWYPSLRLFRQTRAGHWQEVLTRVRGALVASLAAGSAPRMGRGAQAEA